MHSYPKWVWSPTGGWWADPKYWRRNTMAVVGVVVVPTILVFGYLSGQAEVCFSCVSSVSVSVSIISYLLLLCPTSKLLKYIY
jgi:hypothetical protein